MPHTTVTVHDLSSSSVQPVTVTVHAPAVHSTTSHSTAVQTTSFVTEVSTILETPTTSSSSPVAVATIRTSTTILVPPVATIRGTTTVWVAPSSTSSVRVMTYTITESARASSATHTSSSSSSSSRAVRARATGAQRRSATTKPTDCYFLINDEWSVKPCPA